MSRDTAEMLNQLHIKSNGCFLYLERVLDGIADGCVVLREIKDIPGTLNGLYLWFCQRLLSTKHFSKVRNINFKNSEYFFFKPLISIFISGATFIKCYLSIS